MLSNIKVSALDPGMFYTIFNQFTRDQLRELAGKRSIPKGRNKSDTIRNLFHGKDKFRGTTIMISMDL